MNYAVRLQRVWWALYKSKYASEMTRLPIFDRSLREVIHKPSKTNTKHEITLVFCTLYLEAPPPHAPLSYLCNLVMFPDRTVKILNIVFYLRGCAY